MRSRVARGPMRITLRVPDHPAADSRPRLGEVQKAVPPAGLLLEVRGTATHDDCTGAAEGGDGVLKGPANSHTLNNAAAPTRCVKIIGAMWGGPYGPPHIAV